MAYDVKANVAKLFKELGARYEKLVEARERFARELNAIETEIATTHPSNTVKLNGLRARKLQMTIWFAEMDARRSELAIFMEPFTDIKIKLNET